MRTLLCGDQDPVFTREEILKYTEPKLGYTKESPGFLKFVNVLVELTGAERKAFLQVIVEKSNFLNFKQLIPKLSVHHWLLLPSSWRPCQSSSEVCRKNMFLYFVEIQVSN